MFKHSVCPWCYESLSLEQMCKVAVDLGIESIDLVTPQDMPLLKKYDLTCAMVAHPTATAPDGTTIGLIEKSWNRVEYHDALLERYESYLREVAQTGANNVICFSGNRDGMSDSQGLKNCARGLKQLMPVVEELEMTLTIELLNSYVDHPDYMCDHTAWGIDLCDAIGSDHFKLLYDVYHMQIMEGNIIDTIGKHHSYFSHYHTGGVPGRHEIDQRQEINYPAVMSAIVETGYTGYVAQEFIPIDSDPIASLRRAIEICSV